MAPGAMPAMTMRRWLRHSVPSARNRPGTPPISSETTELLRGRRKPSGRSRSTAPTASLSATTSTSVRPNQARMKGP